jgi:sugar lactone lactonase YvrE
MDDTPRNPKILLDGLAYVESPRWHDGRLWFAHWGAGEIVAVDLNGKSEVTGYGPPKVNAAAPGHGLGWSFDWLPDGRLLVTGKELLRREPDGAMVRHADLSAIADAGWNEIVVDGRGNIYVNSINFQYLAGERPASGTGLIALVTPDGTARQVAGGLSFPNGMVITPDNSTLIISESFTGRLLAFDIAADGSLSNRRVWAEGLGPDGICLDTEGAVWVQTPDHPRGAVVRIREGGEVLERIAHDRSIFAVMLGGPDRKTLFLLANEWRGTEQVNEALAARTGQVLVSQVAVSGAGWP